jgi:penicillin amidase
MASNAFAIHGNHSATGTPYLASDPHLSASLPSFWHLVGIHLPDNYAIGASNPGCPFIGQGKSKYMAWA